MVYGTGSSREAVQAIDDVLADLADLVATGDFTPQGLLLALNQSGFVSGTAGKSAYELWLDEGNTGTIEDFFTSLSGTDGKSTYQIWLDAGNIGTNEDFLAATSSKEVFVFWSSTNGWVLPGKRTDQWYVFKSEEFLSATVPPLIDGSYWYPHPSSAYYATL